MKDVEIDRCTEHGQASRQSEERKDEWVDEQARGWTNAKMDVYDIFCRLLQNNLEKTFFFSCVMNSPPRLTLTFLEKKGVDNVVNTMYNPEV